MFYEITDEMIDQNPQLAQTRREQELLEAKLLSVCKEIEGNTGYKLVFLVPIVNPKSKPEDITKASLMAKPHLLLPEAIVKDMDTIIDGVEEWNDECPYGDTYKNSMIIMCHYVPALKKAKSALAKKNYKLALGLMLGVTVSGVNEDFHWLRDQECYMDDDFPTTFKLFCSNWRALLKQDDNVLGLKVPGRPQSCRHHLEDLIKKYQKKANEVFSDIDESTDKPVRINIFTKQQMAVYMETHKSDEDEDDDDDGNGDGADNRAGGGGATAAE